MRKNDTPLPCAHAGCTMVTLRKRRAHNCDTVALVMEQSALTPLSGDQRPALPIAERTKGENLGGICLLHVTNVSFSHLFYRKRWHIR